MKTVFVLMFLVFDGSNGMLAEYGAGAFGTEEACETVKASIEQKAREDMRVSVEVVCAPVPLVAEQ